MPSRSGSQSRALRFGACVLIALGLTLLAALGLSADLFSGFQRRATDSAHPRGRAPQEVAVVGIDARSLAELGQPWPWPRELQAELLGAISEQDPRVIAVDILFAPEAAGDSALAQAIGEAGNVILAEVVFELGGVSDRGLLTSEFVTGPVDELAAGAVGSAQVAVLPDQGDSVVRSVPLVLDDGRNVVPALSLAALALAEGASPEPVVRPDAVQVGQRAIPTEKHHTLNVSYAPEITGADAPVVVPAADLLAGRTDPDLLRDKVVFVGVTDPTLGDHHLSPVAKQAGMPGVLIHANAYSTMATRAYLTDASAAETLAIAFALALFIAVSVQFLRIWVAAGVTILVFAAFVPAEFIRADHGVMPNFVWPTLALVLAVPLSGAVRYALEARQRRLVSNLFALYIPDAVADQLMDSGLVEEVVAGRKFEISTMFCDLRGFTAISAAIDPTQVREMLDLYYEFASQIVLDTEGTLMQYVGDEVFAVWGAPVEDPYHSRRALECASRIQTEKHRLDEQLRERDLPALTFGIGVNSGEVVAAHTGSTQRRQYTVIGDTVNTGSRLCSQAGIGGVVISQAVVDELDVPPRLEQIHDLEMKGVRDDFVAYRVMLDGVRQERREAGAGK